MKDTEKRIAALRTYAILDTCPEEDFDDLTKLTSHICGTPIALISLLDTHRQWFKSSHGLDATETPIEHAFCAHAIEKEGVFLVPDATADPRFSENPLVTGEPNIRFYAGAPLVTPEGVALGTLCAIDRVSREFDGEVIAALSALSRQVVKMLELRRTVTQLDIALAEKRAAESEVSLLQDLIPMCAWCRNVRDDSDFWQSVEDYLAAHVDIDYTHSICPDCSSKIGTEQEPHFAI